MTHLERVHEKEQNVADERSGENLAENADATRLLLPMGQLVFVVSFLRVTQAT
jgi:hypothetical protein